MSSSSLIRLGTRASDLARWQAEWVAARLADLGMDVQLVPISTKGDRQQTGTIGSLGEQGVFTKELQRAMLDDQVDLAVHSLKDLPTDEVPGLCLAAVPERAPVSDVLVSRKFASFEELPPGAVLGTGSLRRRSQLLHARPDLETKDIRGNVDTRLSKLDAGDYDAIVLAEAGLRRLGLAENITQILPTSLMLPAVGQGALGLETRDDDHNTRAAVEQLSHQPTHAAVLAERTTLAELQGGCMAPIAAWGRLEDETFTLSGRVVHPDGIRSIETTLKGEIDAPAELGHRVARALLDQGAAELIRASREEP